MNYPAPDPSTRVDHIPPPAAYRKQPSRLADMMAGLLYGLAVAVVAFLAMGGASPEPRAERSAPFGIAAVDDMPYLGVEAPAWCLEDMACWLGSAADGRSADEVEATLWEDIASANASYGYDTLGPPPSN
ncbi:MAG: hypothetical protein ACRCYU_12120 [Nocardioides sp.]